MAEREFKVKILGDAKGAVDAFRQTEAGLGRFGAIGDKANKSLSSVQGHLDGFGPLGKKASSGIDSVVSGLGGIPPVAAVAGAGLAVAGAAVAKFALDGISKFVAYAGEVRNFQRASGASAETSSRFVAVLDDLAISSETGAAAISKLTRNAAAGKLEPFNIELARTKSGSVDATETLLNVADAYAATADPAERARLRFAAFGKQGDALIPILEKGRAGLKSFFDGVSDAQILNQSELDKAERYRLSMDRLGDSVADVQREFGLAASGPAADFANGLAAIVEKGTQLGKESPSWLERWGQSFLSQLPGFGLIQLGKNTESLAAKQRDAAAAAQELSNELDEEAKALDDVANATLASFNASIAYERSLNSLEDSQSALNDKQRAYTDAVRGHGPASAAATAAAEELSRAQLDAKDAVLQVASAAARNAEQQARMNGQSFDMARDAIPAQVAELSRLRDTLAPGSALRQAVEAYIEQLKSVPSNISTTFSAVTPRVNAKEGSQASGGGGKRVADGAVFTFADGGEKHVAQIARPGDWRVWAEPETGGEAYIPLAPSKRARSTAILADVAQRFGMQVMARGSSGQPGVASDRLIGGGDVHVHVHIEGGTYVGPGGFEQFVQMVRASILKDARRNGRVGQLA